QQVIEVVSHIASTATKFPMKRVVLCIAGICERVADIKTCAQAMKCLTTFFESMGTGFIFEIMSKIMKEHKNPKVLSEGLLWMVFAVDDFGVAHLKLKDVFNFCKDTGLQSSAAVATRNATIKLIGPLDTNKHAKEKESCKEEEEYESKFFESACSQNISSGPDMNHQQESAYPPSSSPILHIGDTDELVFVVGTQRHDDSLVNDYDSNYLASP
ncbi:protein MOR1, partial [Tanacetum coccineum]